MQTCHEHFAQGVIDQFIDDQLAYHEKSIHYSLAFLSHVNNYTKRHQ